MNHASHAGFSGAHLELIAASEGAARAIPPLWPLSSSVAVNPFMGQAHQTLAEAAALMGRVAGIRMTMPHRWYCARMNTGSITDADLSAALAMAPDGAPTSLKALKDIAAADVPAPTALPTIAHLAAEMSGTDWPALIEDRLGAWAAGYFDSGQALWQATPGRGAFESWQIFASHDLTPEITGLTGYARTVANAPSRPRIALPLACDAICLAPEAAKTYFHQLLLGLGGWSQVARQRLWQAELVGRTDSGVTDLLTIRLIWEQALFVHYRARIADRWRETCAEHAKPPEATPAQIAASVLQHAAELAAQRQLGDTLSGQGKPGTGQRPEMQAAFCIDVRSEVFRRALESLDDGIETSGFAGFFGLAVSHRGFASDVEELRLPVLLNAGLRSTAPAPDGADQTARLAARASRAWGRFKLAAVSSFAFVEAAGPIYVARLLRDATAQANKDTSPPPAPRIATDTGIDDRITAAATILRAMSMTDGFAPLVLLIGHGANVVNNPHASALHCGACGGHAGDVNARLLAGLLNDAEVRAGLAGAGIHIPADTVFIGGLHDTTTDAVTLYAADAPGAVNASRLARAEHWLAAAGGIARTERALRLPRADNGAAIAQRSTNWAETRPEWALAGCNTFIVAPRSRTRGKVLHGRAFLHDYDWQKDEGFGVLELILTAPVVVASWISLQYYGSVVAPDVFGAGNKLLHNVTGGIGVVEGNGGVLRSGLPWQSVHDGTNFAHDPLRLAVCIEAPQKAVVDILERHPAVRALFENRWLHLLLIKQNGQLAPLHTRQ